MDMSARYLLDIEKKKLFAIIEIEDSINRVWHRAVSKLNIDGNIIDECYLKFGEGLANYVINFLKDFFFNALIEKNTSFVLELREEITAMTDDVVSKMANGDVKQIEGAVNKVVERAGDRRIYGNIDNFLIANINNVLNVIRYNSGTSFDEEKANILLSNIKLMVQDFIFMVLDGNKNVVDSVITNYVNEIIKIVKDKGDFNKALGEGLESSETYDEASDFLQIPVSEQIGHSVHEFFEDPSEKSREFGLPKM